jgi:hypothetical protein
VPPIVANAARYAALTNANDTQRTFMKNDHKLLGLKLCCHR